MNILHVEDDKSWFDRIIHPALLEAGAEHVFHAENLELASSILESESIDYVILDLAIPLNNDTPTAELANGLNLASYIRLNFAGVPILILTGQSTEEALERFVEDLPVTTFWDGKPKHIVKVKKKHQLDVVMDTLSSAIQELNAISAIELSHNGCELDKFEKRIIQLFSKHNNAIGAEVESISGGLSSSRVLRVTLINNNGPFHFALAKIDTHDAIDTEDNNFRVHINKLPVGSFPTLLDMYYAGCGNKKGIFYQFAANYESDYFNELVKSEKVALDILQRLKLILNYWTLNYQVKQCTVKEIREKLCTDVKFNSLEEILKSIDSVNIDDFERNQISVNSCVQHSDLHGKNILISDTQQPIIIDYGDINEVSSVLDILTLELSPYFHPSIREQFSPPIEFFDNWFDDEYHIKHSPTPEVATFLRNWKSECCFMNRQYIVTVYAYAVRQLTYEGTNKEYAKALIKSAINNF